jgi:hypothetical protein
MENIDMAGMFFFYDLAFDCLLPNWKKQIAGMSPMNS